MEEGGERVVEKLLDIAVTASIFFSQKGRNVGGIIEVTWTVMGYACSLEGAEMLERIARGGVPAEV